MKKVKTWLLMALVLVSTAFCANAQKSTNVVIGIAVQSDEATTSFEIGKNFGVNSFNLITQTYQTTGSERQWDAGVKFYRTLYNTANTDLTVRASMATLVSLTGTYNYITFQPGLSVNYNFNKTTALGFETNTPIYEGSVLFKPILWQAGVSLRFTLQ